MDFYSNGVMPSYFPTWEEGVEQAEVMSLDGRISKYGCMERGVRYRRKDGSKS